MAGFTAEEALAGEFDLPFSVPFLSSLESLQPFSFVEP
jgi:hypothetical protein